MIITDEAMRKKMQRALDFNGNLYSLDDIEEHLLSGKLQSHAEGETWVITQVHDWPQRRAVNIMYLVGSLAGTPELEQKIEEWARSIGADIITAGGRDGWLKFRTPGWKKIGSLFSKDI